MHEPQKLTSMELYQILRNKISRTLTRKKQQATMQMSAEISSATTARLPAAAARHLAKEAASLPSQLLLVFDGLLLALGGLWDRDMVQHAADERIGRLPRLPAPRASKQRAEFSPESVTPFIWKRFLKAVQRSGLADCSLFAGGRPWQRRTAHDRLQSIPD